MSPCLEPQGAAEVPFQQLYDEIAPTLFVWARCRLQPPLSHYLDAQDLIQETWVRAAKSIGTFDADKGAFRDWVFGIARNVLLEAWRRIRGPGGAISRERLGISSAGDIPESVTSLSVRLMRNETVAIFLSEVDQLEPEERLLLVWCGFERLALKDVASRLSISRDAAAKRWQRLRSSLATDERLITMLGGN